MAGEPEKPQDPSREANASSIHGDDELNETSIERCDTNGKKKKEDDGVDKDKGKKIEDGEQKKEDENKEKKFEDEEEDIDEDHKKTLEYAEVLMRKGSTALKENDYVEAAEYYSRALEIRVAHFGEFDQECFSAYYFYGLALLRNALAGCLSVSNEDGSTPAASCSMNYVSSNVENDESSDSKDKATKSSDSEDSATGLKEKGNEFDTDDTPDNDEDDLDLAWQILNIARIIVEKRPAPSMDNVNVLCALAEINNYKDDYVNCLLDYSKAMSILGILGDPDMFLTARTYYKMGLCVELRMKTDDNILYYKYALSCCSIALKSLSKDLDSLLSEKIAVPDTLISKKREEIAAAQNFSEMLKHKLQDEEEINNNKPTADIRGAVDSLSAKVRKLKENVCSRTDYRCLGRMRGYMKKIRVILRSDSYESSPPNSLDSDNLSSSNSLDSVHQIPRKSSDSDNPSPSNSSHPVNSSPSHSSKSVNSSHSKSSNSVNSSPSKSSNSVNSSSSNSSHPVDSSPSHSSKSVNSSHSMSSNSVHSSPSKSSNSVNSSSSKSSNSGNPSPLKIPKLEELETKKSNSQ